MKIEKCLSAINIYDSDRQVFHVSQCFEAISVMAYFSDPTCLRGPVGPRNTLLTVLWAFSPISCGVILLICICFFYGNPQA